MRTNHYEGRCKEPSLTVKSYHRIPVISSGFLERAKLGEKQCGNNDTEGLTTVRRNPVRVSAVQMGVYMTWA